MYNYFLIHDLVNFNTSQLVKVLSEKLGQKVSTEDVQAWQEEV